MSGELLADVVVETLEFVRIDGIEVERTGIGRDLSQIDFVEFRAETDGVDRHVDLTGERENVGDGLLTERFAGAVVINTVAKQHNRLAARDGAQRLERSVERIPQGRVAARHCAVNSRTGASAIAPEWKNRPHVTRKADDLCPVLCLERVEKALRCRLGIGEPFFHRAAGVEG